MSSVALFRSPLTLPLLFAGSMAAWLAASVSDRVPHQPYDGNVWIYVSSICDGIDGASSCRPIAGSPIRTFDDRDACAAYLDADLNAKRDPRMLGSCLRRPEA